MTNDRMNATGLAAAVRAAICATAATTTATPVMAQDDAEPLATITVVGSRIKRTDSETSQPVLVIERAELLKTGLTSVGDILQQLVSNGAALNTAFNNGGNGETRVDLRGLGSNRTLVLVNGRRWVTTLDGAVDLNTIPLPAIERVEVLKDGASAIYGSDAIAGVVNITTRDVYEGAEATAYLGGNGEGDGRTQAYDFTLGSTTDRANIVINASYLKQEPIFAGDREISAVPAYGFPGNNVNAGASSTTPFGRFDGAGIPATVVLIPGRPGTSPGDFRPYDAATDGFNYVPDNYLLTPQERSSMFAQGRYQLTDAIGFNTTILVNERKSEQLLAPIGFTLGPIFGNTVTVSPQNLYNPFGVEITRAQYRNTLQRRSFNQDADTFYFGSGFDGVFDLWNRSFGWDLNAIYSDNELRDVTFGQFDLNRLRQGLGPSFIDASGTPRCGTAAAVLAGCVPVDLFGGPDAFTREMADFTGVTLKDETNKELYDYTANITGDLFELPAGPLGFAAGYEYRREQGYFLPDAITASGATTGSAAQPTNGGFSLDEFYAEFNVPVLKDLAFAQVLEISLAARYSDYSNFGDTTNPKAGLRWKPVDDLLVRGNWSRGFRAPSVSELFLGASDNFPDVTDPCAESSNPQGVTLANCRNGIGALPPVPPGYEPSGGQARSTVGGNPLLQPEFATSKTLGLVYSPDWASGLDVYLDWYNIEIENAISRPTAGFVLLDCYTNGELGNCANITRLADGTIAALLTNNQNLPDGTETEGYDLSLNYRWDSRWGQFNANWDNAYVSYYGDVGQPEGGNVSGEYFGTTFAIWRWKSNLNLDWEHADWGARVGFRYLSALDEDCTAAANLARLLGDAGSPTANPCSDPDRFVEIGGVSTYAPVNSLGSTLYTDVQATWNTPWNGRITAGINNLFDEDPPVSYSTFINNFDPAYDIPGRFWYLRYAQQF